MASEFFLDIVFGVASGILNLMPDITWSVETTAFQYFMNILGLVGYMFPWQTVVDIASIIISVCIFRVGIAVVRFILSLLSCL